MLLISSVFFSIYLINISCCNLRWSVARLWDTNVGRGMCIQLLLVSVLLLAFVSPFSSSREFSGFTPQVTKVNVFFLVLVYVFNFILFEFSAAILEKDLLTV